MSEYRYFLAANTVTPTPVKPSEVADYKVAHPCDAEVQVVPLDAIVIRREDLPEVEVLSTFTRTEGASFNHKGRLTAEDFDRMARGNLALAAHLRENPPVDERAVDDLQDLLIEMGSGHARRVAHALIATGRVKVEP